MACTSSFLRSLKRTMKKKKKKKTKSTGFAVTNATETDTHAHTHKTWRFDEMQQCFAIMTSRALFNLVTCL